MTKEEFIQAIESMTVKELAELVSAIEERFGVSAAVAAPVAVATAAPTATAEAGPAAKTTVDVVLTNAGQQKIQLIKVVKDITGKGLKECKDLVDNVPAVVKSGVSREEAEDLKKKLEAAGRRSRLSDDPKAFVRPGPSPPGAAGLHRPPAPVLRAVPAGGHPPGVRGGEPHPRPGAGGPLP